MSKFVEIIADDKTFRVSNKTLENNPEFIITQIRRDNLTSVPSIVEVINEAKYVIDIKPELLESIINNMRSNYDVNSILFPEARTVESLEIKTAESTAESTDQQGGTSIFSKQPNSKLKNDFNYVDFSVASDKLEKDLLRGFLGNASMSTDLDSSRTHIYRAKKMSFNSSQ